MDDAGAIERLRTTAAAIVDGVERAVPGWVEAQVLRIVDAWDRLDADERQATERAAASGGAAAAARIGGQLRTLFTLDPAEQRGTPLEIVRTAYREPTAILAAAGIPPVERDAFDERAWPDDDYGLVPHAIGDLGDDDLGPLLLGWGLAKAKVLRGRDPTGAGTGGNAESR